MGALAHEWRGGDRHFRACAERARRSGVRRSPDVGRALKAGEACAVVESVKAASDVYSPVSGKVTAGNAALASSPNC
jgi:glycine cleavage system H lipoate-binding protein